MKKLIILFIISLTLYLGGCNVNEELGKNSTSDGVVLSDGVLSDGSIKGAINDDIPFSVEKHLGGPFKSAFYDNPDIKPTAIYSVYELEELFSWFDSYKLINYEMESDRERHRKDLIIIEAEIADIKSSYDVEFFEENALIFYNKTFGNCYSIPVINSVLRDGNNGSINATRYVNEGMDEALQNWAGFIEVKKADVEGVENIELNVIEVVTEDRLSDNYPNGY
ncbi:hypothetical protein FACS1894132_14880 [Clostridia bacterium]|nr:hypothetical protein FACS1894132_14880 [Clostridia bacterium]